MAYVRSNIIYYRSTNQINTMDLAPEDVVSAGSHPTLVIDRAGFAHIFYMEGETVLHRRQAAGEWQPATIVAHGTGVSATITKQGLIVTAVQSGDFVRIYRLEGTTWIERQQYHTDGTLRGAPQINADQEWVYVAWVTEQLDPVSTDWPRRRPEYKPAEPFINRIRSGSNAQQYFTTYGVHLAGLYQRVSTVPGNQLSASAHFMAWSCEGCGGVAPEDSNPPSIDPANMRVQICIDPSGGVDILNPMVTCSAPNNTLDAWTQISVNSVAVSSSATVFLKSNPDLPRQNNDLYWDDATFSGTLLNGGFEGGFPTWQGIAELKAGDGWAPFYIEDAPLGVSNGRYTVYTAWSNDEATTWNAEHPVAMNAHSGNQKTGNIGIHAFPVVEAANDRVAIAFLYNEGDPSFTGGTIRYGRPSVVLCGLGQTNCAPGDSGARLLPASANRPVVNLGVNAMNGSAVVAWDAYQSSHAQNRDVFATTFSPSRLRITLVD